MMMMLLSKIEMMGDVPPSENNSFTQKMKKPNIGGHSVDSYLENEPFQAIQSVLWKKF